MGIDVNHSKLPLLVVTFKGTVSDDQFRQYLQETSAVLDMGRRYVTIMDATHAAVPTPTQRKMQADWMKKEAPRVGAHSLGAAFVIDSVLIRGALTAIFWLQPMAAPHIVVADLESAMTWARSRLPPP